MIAPMSSFSKSASSSSDEDVELRRGPWTLEEDSLLIRYIACHGEGRWNLLAKRSGLRRTGKSCRLRWLNYLKPDVKRGNLTPQEQLLILDLHSKWGNRWSKIAQHLPGRTDNEIKNYWRTRVQKQARHLKIDTNSTAFQEVIRCFWMPRLIQKIQGSSPSLAISSQTSNTQPFIHIANEHSLLSGQVPAQGPFNMTESLDSLEYQAKNSSSQHCTSPSISSSESMNISQIPQISENPTGPFHAMANTDHYNTYLKNCYNVDNIGYDTQPFSLTSVSAPGDFGNPISESCNWIDHNDLADSLWNMDELWQFRQPQERAPSLGHC